MRVVELRKAAKRLGLSGYSRLNKPQLEAALSLIEVHRGDLKATRRLGSAYLRTCKVGKWRNKGNKSRPIWESLSWLVPAGVLAQHGLTPISEAEAGAKRAELSASAKASYGRRLSEACSRIGAITGSRTARDLALGRIDPDLTKLIAFKAAYRHEHTDYDRLIASSEDRDFARREMSSDPIPEEWPSYLEKYGFHGEVAEALARTLEEPHRCHPVWFKEAEIAVRRGEPDLGELTYEGVREAILDWRAELEDE